MTNCKRRTFTPEQKAQALRLAEELGNVSQAARDLGIPAELIYRWRTSKLVLIQGVVQLEL